MLIRNNRTGRSLSLTLILAGALGVGCSDENNEAEAGSDSQPTSTESAPDKAETAAKLASPADESTVDYREIKWEELIPQEDLDALLNPPEYYAMIPEGSDEDVFPTEEPLTIDGPASAEMARYQQALQSAKIKPEFDQQQVRIPGFVVPLEFDDDQTITSFLLVPYFGACMHLPPPPPNQVIYAKFPEGFQVEFLYDPVYIEGELRTLPEDTERGNAAYTINVARVSAYEE
ncbi:DUF3299 domain-containing protein [Microbulbifer sp. HZ11]|uniref:DUF3299 domain-containing protein n=1 Tax=Microbulbifer sp. HZ11 TaxID=1453501 RepID=UPI0009DEA8FE|nr:DUF3299 domain-containing protein [Microbulbifer sp. HZ11]